MQKDIAAQIEKAALKSNDPWHQLISVCAGLPLYGSYWWKKGIRLLRMSGCTSRFCTACIIDSSSFCELYRKKDMEMRIALSGRHPHFERLTKFSMTAAELMIASDAMQNHFFSPEKHCVTIPAIKCEQEVLEIIGDFMVQVDVILLSEVTVQPGTLRLPQSP